jgi:hypothetical protein
MQSQPNLPADAAMALTAWVKAGGHLILSCAGAVLDEYNTPTPTVWQDLGLLPAGPPPDDFQSWAPASRMNVHVAGSDVWSAATVSNGSGVSPLYSSLAVEAFGRRCLGSRERQIAGIDDSVADETVLARFADGATAVSLRELGSGSVVHFSWLPGVSHLSASAKPKGAPPNSPAPSALTDAARWLAEMVELARNPAPQQTAVATVDVPSVETPILLSSLGAVVTVLDWRPPTSRSQELILNMTLPFQPHMVDSAQGGALIWQPHTRALIDGNWHTGSVVLTTPRDGADYVSFHRKPTEEA